MYGAAAWLAWVFTIQAGSNALPFLFASALALALAAWLWGAAQRGERPLVPRLASAAAVLAAIPLVVLGARMSAPETATAAVPSSQGALPAEPWSPERVAALRAESRPVFVDFTAAWCVTCQVNERTTLASKAVIDAFARHHAAYLKANWTNRNAQIANALSALGRSGVPLYLLYDAKGSPQPKILPQLLTEGGVVAALNAAAQPKT